MRVVVAVVVSVGSLQLFASQVAAAPAQLPGVRVDLDAGFEYDMNSRGEYVVAWSPTGNSKVTQVLRGSVHTGIQRTWAVSSTFDSTPAVAIAENGTMALAWTVSRSRPLGESRVKKAAVWNASDAVLVPHTLDRRRLEFFDDVGGVDVAINDAGNAAFSWVFGSTNDRIRFAIGHADGSFTPSKTIFKDRRPGFLGNPKVSIDNAGGAMVRWTYLGMDCKNDWIVPKHCRDEARSLAAVRVSADLQLLPLQSFGKNCEWSDGDSAPTGESIAIMMCRHGFRYTAALSGQPYAASIKLSTLPGRMMDNPEVRLLANGHVIVAYESLRRVKHGYFSQNVANAGMVGLPLGPPTAISAEVDYSDAENQGGYWGNRPSIVEGPGSQAYLAWTHPGAALMAKMDISGNLGPSIEIPIQPSPFRAQFNVVAGGVGFAIWPEETDGPVRLWTTSFSPPSL